MRLIVTGAQGQVARSLFECGPQHGVEVTLIGRPDLDLADPATIARAIGKAEGDVVVSAAAYTAVDKAETEEALATQVNGVGAGLVAAAAAIRGLPVIHLSTDYVFDGSLERPYREDDPTQPIGAYGRSKLEGERAVAAADPKHVILRTAWVYSPFGANFVKTMLRLGQTRSEVNVVADQRGAPTSALDIADAVIGVAKRLVEMPARADLTGIFHMTSAGEASWAEFAEAIFDEAARRGRQPVNVRRIASSQYPTPARRPANSRLDTSRFRRTYGIELPAWRESMRLCVARVLADMAK
jgi:dTDP-4-dehydrorhamnose reductase